jgi:glycosyltransferase involved in cell wall biosynthesis
MATTRPLVGFAVGGLPEVVADGETGLLSPAGDEEALARDLVRVLADPELAARLGRAGRRRFVDRYAPEEMARAHVELYDGLVGAARGRRARSSRTLSRAARRRPGSAG